MKKKILAVFFLAFIVRLIALDQSLWLDEATTAKVVRDIPFDKIISTFSRYDFHPPLYYFMMKVWSLIFGSSEAALRFPSVIYSLLTALVIVKVGKLIKNELIGNWAAIFFLFNPLIIYYSQEARMYMMATFFLSLVFYFFLKLWRSSSNNLKNLLGINAFIFLSIFTFYGSILFIIPLYLFLLYKGNLRLLVNIIPGSIAAILFLSPLLYLQYINAKNTLNLVPYWSNVLGNANLKNLLLIPLKFTVGRISFYPKIVYYLISSISAVIVLLFMILGGRKNTKLMFFGFSPILFGFIISFFTPLLQYFRFLFLLPIFCILISLGTKVNWQRYIVLSIFVLFSVLYLLFPQFHREDWRSLAKNLSGTNSIYIINSFIDPLRYYHSNLNFKKLESINSSLSNESPITVIPYAIELYNISYKEILGKNNYRLRNVTTVRGLIKEEWVR